MAATRGDVDMWIKTARINGNEFIISVCDTFDYDDYPIYCSKKNLKEKYKEVDGKDMQIINEIIRVPRKKPAIENYIWDF